MELRHDWKLEEVMELAQLPILDLLFRAQAVHREAWPKNQVQLCSLLSIKTGGCPEDCGYCSQSARAKTGVTAEPLMLVDDVLKRATQAKEAGATRFCMGAAWRQVKDGRQFDSVLEMVRGVKALGMEACVTLGMLNASQAKRLSEAGLDAYNHNLDTSEAHYDKVITTRTYAERLQTLALVRDAGIQVCCGGILGLGESLQDRCELLRTLANQPKHPESVPINALVPVKGTRLQDRPPVGAMEMAQAIALARLLMPKSMVRLSAGRAQMSDEAQLLCMMAGANSLFFGEKLLTTDNGDYQHDLGMLERAGMTPLLPGSTAAQTRAEE